MSDVALQHQERWDGSGYPRGLKGKDIHEYGRIAAIADVYEALTSSRAYRGPNEPYQAYEYLTANAEVLFDARLVGVFADLNLLDSPSLLIVGTYNR